MTEVCYNKNGVVTNITYGSPYLYTKRQMLYEITYCNEVPINCNDGNVSCDGTVFFQKPVAFGCGIPCNYGDWEYDFMTVSYPQCGEGCEYILVYRYRTTVGCNPEYYDYDLMQIINFNESCTFWCINLFSDWIYQWSLYQLLINGKHIKPLAGRCIDQYRLMTYSCWRVENGVQYPCIGDGCCWSLYRLCRDVSGVLLPPIKISDNSSGEASCTGASAPCEFRCPAFFTIPLERILDDNDINKSEINNLDKFIHHCQETEDEIEIFISAKNIKNPQLQIYDLLGNIILSEININDNDIIKFKIVKENLKSGIYLYNILNDGIKIGFGKFVLSK